MKSVLFIFSVILILGTSQDGPQFFERITEMYENILSRSARFLLPTDYTNHFENRPSVENETYDFVIVGSGSAGSVIANRLSEVGHWKVLLLEIGEAPHPITDIPVIAPALQFTNYSWNYKTEKQDNVYLGLEDDVMAWPRGRALGGTTVINYMIHVRGNKIDYDRWAAMGNPGWSYEEVLPYFIKSEDARIKRQDENYHGKGGYLTVEDVPHRTESARAFVEACQEAGYPLVDYNGKTQNGVSYIHANLRNGKRCSATTAFIDPVIGRRNLKILTRSRVTRVVIDPDTKEATGVEYVRNGKKYIATASKETILSAGAFNSPQLLMLSGVGPKDHLQEVGIDVIQNLPVGEKIYDHLTFIGLLFTVNESIVNEQKSVENPVSFLDFFLNGKGPLTSTGVEALTYIKTNISDDPEDYPDVELIFIGGGLHTDRGQIYGRQFRVKKRIYDALFKPLEDTPAFMILPMLVHPKSFGYMKLKSKNPFYYPKFYGKYFTDPDNTDIKTFTASIREAQRIVASPAMAKYGAKIVDVKIPGCESHDFNSDEYWECALRHISVTLHHQVASCKMGPENDTEAVVDNELRVYGVRNLRVADASVIPLPVTAHTNVPSYMVGEKASDLIKRSWGE